MKQLLTIFAIVLACVSGSAATKQAREKQRGIVVPAETVLPVVAFQPECPVRFEKAETIQWLGEGRGVTHRYVLRNDGTKPVVAVKVVAITQVGTGVGADIRAHNRSEWIMPGEVWPRSLSGEIIPSTPKLLTDNHLDGSMQGIIVFMIVRVEFSDGTAYDNERANKRLEELFQANPCSH